jgi:hypothetical protein
MMKTRWMFVLIALAFLCGLSVAAEPVRFEKIVVDKTFRSEGVTTGDVNHDGKPVLVFAARPVGQMCWYSVAG